MPKKPASKGKKPKRAPARGSARMPRKATSAFQRTIQAQRAAQLLINPDLAERDVRERLQKEFGITGRQASARIATATAALRDIDPKLKSALRVEALETFREVKRRGLEGEMVTRVTKLGPVDILEKDGRLALNAQEALVKLLGLAEPDQVEVKDTTEETPDPKDMTPDQLRAYAEGLTSGTE